MNRVNPCTDHGHEDITINVVNYYYYYYYYIQPVKKTPSVNLQRFSAGTVV